MVQIPFDLLPFQFRDRLITIIPPKRYQSVMDAFCNKRPTSFRLNTLKSSYTQLELDLHKNNIEVQKVSWYQNAFILKNKSKELLMETQTYKNGCIYIQSLSSMLAPLFLDPHPEELILDLAAAPGSKTTQMAALMGNKGKIIANDKSHIRRYKLEANLKLQGVTNTSVTKLPGQILWHSYPEYFDKSLVDVPCSMEGRINCQDRKTFEGWSMKKIKSMVQLQRFLLRSAVSSTKPNGIIVYSTCTLAPEENEGIIDWILDKEKGAVQVEKVNMDMDGLVPGLTQWNNKRYNPQLRNTIRILPSSLMEGFYIAKLKKLKSTVPGMLQK